MQDYVYLILSSSSSLPAKLIKRFTGDRINHSSLAVEPSLHCMYSFGRRYLYNAFYGGFVQEDRDRGFYARFSDTYAEVYRLPVSREVYLRTKNYLEDCYAAKDQFRYNVLGMIATRLGFSIARKNTYFCSEFVAEAIQLCGIRPIARDIHTYRPSYFYELEDKELIYAGLLREYQPVEPSPFQTQTEVVQI